ncbi:MAG: hypothetical protein BroJett018_19580 [Chloroflexota bacterium]|nr:response regulator [Chloroflexota bacterium]NOG62471.1 response regulator [Chloroflexota bacterium]GIK64164.1 MAG: hypothetical protein BroJett018_19580 [Chloroflexota bacterium]
MNPRSAPIPRHYFFTLEDGTWVVQRGMDRVQELLTGAERTYSSLDISFEIEDLELELLKAQGVIDRYDDSFVWLHEDPQNEIVVPTSTLQKTLGVAVYYFVQTGLDVSQLELVQEHLDEIGLADRYRASERQNNVIIIHAHDEPFSRLGSAEDAETLVMPALTNLGAKLKVEAVRFNAQELPMLVSGRLFGDIPNHPLVRKLEPKIKLQTVICVDHEMETHTTVREVVEVLGQEMVSAFTVHEALALLQDVDPALLLVSLDMPDMHGYKVVAAVRNDPELSRIPILILNTLDTDKDRTLAFNVANAVDFVMKPVYPERIRRKIWRVLNQYTTLMV